MKIRKGFVSNSSSASFICDVCGETAAGMDMTLDDADMYECVNGHTFCRMESIGNSVVGEDGKLIISERNYTIPEGADEMEAECNIPEKNCPCCTFNSVSSHDLIYYLLKRAGMDREAISEEIRKKFKTYKSFLESSHKKA